MDTRPRFGVEEEFLVVDPLTRAVVPRAGAVLSRVDDGLAPWVSGEVTELQVETRTEPCATVGELREQLVMARRAVHQAAVAEGLRVMASGTPVLGRVVPSPITRGQRQDRGVATFRALQYEFNICALHVHVELPERERAVLVSNHLRPHLPVLAALAANSPYWAERDTGYASWRVMQWHRWPVAGPPPYFSSAAHYDELVAIMLGADAMVDVGNVFWDIRPSARLPTLEVRVADVPITVAESVLIAALVRALVEVALEAVDQGDRGPLVAGELMRLAYWRAARDGLSGHGIDVRTGRPVPVADQARELVRVAAPALARHGELEQVTEWLDLLVRGGGGAARQRAVAARRGRLTDVVDHLVEWTTSDAELTV